MYIFADDDDEKKTKKMPKQPRKPRVPKGVEKETEEIRETQMFLPPSEQDLDAPPPLIEPTVITEGVASIPPTIIDSPVQFPVPDIVIQDHTIIQPNEM